MALHFPTVDWASNTNVYEVNIRQYTPEGTFHALEEHLPRLAAMGIKILWLMPVTPISTIGRKGSLGSYYANSSFTQVNPEFGTLEDLQGLVVAAHALGMKLIIDWVANHTGIGHEWAAAHPEWYVHDATGQFVERNGWDDVIDLDYAQDTMQDALIAAMQYWIQTADIDGFRCDMAHLVPLDFWKKARTACDRLKPLFWMAECDSPEYLEVFDANYAWNWMHASEHFTQRQGSLQEVITILKNDVCTFPQAQKLFFTSNHDENSWNGTEYEKYGSFALSWAVFAAVFPGIPLIYSGQELPSHKRLLFFDKDEIAWQNDRAPKLGIFYQQLLAFRKGSPLYTQKMEVKFLTVNEDCILAFTLQNEAGFLIAIFNFSDHGGIKVSHRLPEGKTFKSLHSGIEYRFAAREEFVLGAYDFLVYYTL